MENSSQIAWKIVPLRHLFPLKVVPLIEVHLYRIPREFQHQKPPPQSAPRSQTLMDRGADDLLEDAGRETALNEAAAQVNFPIPGLNRRHDIVLLTPVKLTAFTF
jgi:hypothetical protein